MPDSSSACPCGLPASYAACCGRFHTGPATPATAEQLMRSRYSAFVVGDRAYLLRTWHSQTRPSQLDLSLDLHWTDLEIITSTDGTAFHTEGTVEFRANYRGGSHHETSYFTREHGDWRYVSGGGARGR